MADLARVRILDPAVADQIAAGEVVERPASILKELVENALDAGARRIVAEISVGGRESVSVRDDGVGMMPEDARLALLRHATSKIRAIGDLQRLETLGFRGEALPSIASVSRLELITRPYDAASGWRVTAAGGRVTDEGPAGAPPGTTVTVKDLFYNTPARAAGLRGSGPETAACARTLEEMAIAHAGVAFRLIADGRTLWQTQGNGRVSDVLAAIYGPDFARGCLPLEAGEGGGLRVQGSAGLPALARGSRAFQVIAVNGHPVRHAGIRSAAESAYRGLVPERRFPAFFLLVSLDPATVDVNVHPRKAEVRFADERRVTGAVYRAVSAALRAADLTPDVGLLRPGARAPGPDRAAEAIALYFPGADRAGSPPGEAVTAPPAGPGPAAADGQRFPPLSVVGAFRETYLIATGSDGIYVVDQHAAHERIHYERILRREPAAVAAQFLSLPLVVEMPAAIMAAWASWSDLLAQHGLLAEPFGAGALAVRTVPAAFGRKPEACLRDFLDRLFGDDREDGARPGPADPRLLAFARAACRAAVKGQDALSAEERQALVDELRRLDEPFTCPHGRPTVWKVTETQLERYFGRR